MGDYGSPTDLAYDLRQIYARIVGEHMLDIAIARKADNFYKWFKSLEDLHTITKHKFRKNKEEKETYETLREKVVSLANANRSAWSGNANAEKRGEIETALRKLERYLYMKMNEAKMFGESGRVAGL